MTRINKQRFLPELGKLLTFMAEEDRQTALNMYSKCFDDAEDEQQLMDLLVSPTRQAVVIARSYDSRERKHSKDSAEEAEQLPAFVLAIDKIYQQVAPHREISWDSLRVEKPEAAVDQFSLFPDEPHPIDDSEYLPFRIDAETVSLDETAEDAPEAVLPTPTAEEAPAAPVTEPKAEPAEEKPAETKPAEAKPAEQPVAAPKAKPAEAKDVPAAPKAEPEELPVRELDYQLLETKPEPPQQPQQPDFSFEFPDLEAELKPSVKISAADFDLDFVPETKEKTRVFLLILYILLAIPVALAGIVLLLIPALAALALAVGVIVLGSAALVAAFSLFQQLADLLILLGTAIIVLALGLLLLWLFVWFVGGAIGGLIRAVTELGRKWCYEEVPV